jgi:hypothetical protein
LVGGGILEEINAFMWSSEIMELCSRDFLAFDVSMPEQWRVCKTASRMVVERLNPKRHREV